MKINNEHKDTLYLFVLQGMNYLIPILLMPYLMINLGVKSYGLIGFSTAIIQFLILFVDFGFNMSATKRIAVHKDNKEALSRIFFSTVFAKVALLSISIFAFIIIINISKFHEYQIALLCTLPMLIGNTFTFTWFYQGIGYIRFLSVLSMCCRILILPSLFYFVKEAQDYIYAILINSSVYIVISVISIYWIYKNKLIILEKFSFQDMKFEVKESFPFFLSTASISLYTQLFVVILGLFTNPAVVGVYTAAEKIIRAISLLFYTPINQVYYPKIAHLASHNKSLALSTVKKVFKFSLYLMAFLSLTILLFSSFIEKFIGHEYKGISSLLLILCLVPVFSAVGGVAGQMGLIAYIDSTKAKKTFQNIYVLAGLFAVCQVTIFTYLFQAEGTSFAVLSTEIFVAGLMIYYFKKYLKVEERNKTYM